MIVEKNGVTYVLTDQTQIDAFLTSGWKPVEEPPAPEMPPDTGTETAPDDFEPAPEGDGQGKRGRK